MPGESPVMMISQLNTEVPAPKTQPFANDEAARFWLEQFTLRIYDSEHGDNVFDRTAHPSYLTILNGQPLSRQEARQHFANLRTGARAFRYSFLRVLATAHGLCDHHLAEITYRSGQIEVWSAQMILTFSGNQLTRIEEVATLLWSGDEKSASEADLVTTGVLNACQQIS